jgi:hypothetical protein
MANYPVGISLSSNTDLILEITDDDSTNTGLGQGLGFGFVRQIGALVFSCSVDDEVYYNIADTFMFNQSGVTYLIVKSENILFVQGALP